MRLHLRSSTFHFSPFLAHSAEPRLRLADSPLLKGLLGGGARVRMEVSTCVHVLHHVVPRNRCPCRAYVKTHATCTRAHTRARSYGEHLTRNHARAHTHTHKDTARTHTRRERERQRPQAWTTRARTHTRVRGQDKNPLTHTATRSWPSSADMCRRGQASPSGQVPFWRYGRHTRTNHTHVARAYIHTQRERGVRSSMGLRDHLHRL